MIKEMARHTLRAKKNISDRAEVQKGATVQSMVVQHLCCSGKIFGKFYAVFGQKYLFLRVHALKDNFGGRKVHFCPMPPLLFPNCKR